jgi:PAS domain-containing protein
MPDTRETFFLPAARLSQEKILDLAREIAASPTALSMGLVPLAVIIVNETRQIVYANERFTSLIGASAFEEVAGKRPGEALGCSHAWETKAAAVPASPAGTAARPRPSSKAWKAMTPPRNVPSSAQARTA